MGAQFFEKPSGFRKWLQKNHKKETELVVGYYKTGSGRPSMTWSESVDQALCFGWIDGVRQSIDKDSYQIRFTPRKPGSIWSAVNIKKMEVLKEQGLLQPAGIAAFEKRKEERSKVYSHEKEETQFAKPYLALFKANKKAWKYFESLAPSYQKLSKHWVMSAKQEATQRKRLQQVITESELGTNQWKDNKYKKK